MTQYLLDTNVISELRKPKPHGAVVEWVTAQSEEQLFLSAVTIGEVQAGIERVRENDPRKAVELEHWLDQIANSYNVLSMDATCFREWGRLMHRQPDQLLEDAMIAATARVHRLTVATRNERDFIHLGVSILNPFAMRA
ncbi:MAG TPA: type II toxin-antitoxin system VapC family toxin [Terriglobales bacterium]|nr:type II toxin-antitoxin system VapC family toxin [Terriglobales bacterium]